MKLFAYHLDDPRNTNEEFDTPLQFLGWSFLTDLERWAFAVIDSKCELPIFGSDAEEIIRIWGKFERLADEEARALGVNKRQARLSSV